MEGRELALDCQSPPARDGLKLTQVQLLAKSRSGGRAIDIALPENKTEPCQTTAVGSRWPWQMLRTP